MSDGKRWAEHAVVTSPDPNTKVGAALMQDDLFICMGSNYFPPGIPFEWWDNRALKYMAVVHAEEDVLLRAGPKARGATLYVTHHPCRNCARLILAAGIREVHCPEGPWRDSQDVVDSVRDAKLLFNLGGVNLVHKGY